MKRLFSARALSMFTWVLILVALPSGLYLNHVYNQLSEVRENNLRTLAEAAEITEQRLSTALQNIGSLESKPGLLQRGLIVRDPGLRINNQSFAHFIAPIQDPDEVKTWEQSANGISWCIPDG